MNEQNTTAANPDEEPVIIYTGASSLGNPGPGGWGAVMQRRGKKRTVAGGLPSATSQQLEMMAAIQALESRTRPLSVVLCSGSEYVIRGMMHWLHEWKGNGGTTSSGKPITNPNLWARLEAAAAPHVVSWNLVPGHKKGADARKEAADKLARAEAQKLIDQGFKAGGRAASFAF